MYTQCPDCQIAFRVTALVLQQAGGRVRCGGCGHAFSALDHLTESMPGPTDTPLDDSPGGEFTIDIANDEIPADDNLAETSRRLLETLDELAGPGDVRIEDTGVEWRVLDEVVGSQEDSLLQKDPAAQESLQLDAEDKPETFERRYDDNTPLDDDFDDDRGEYTPPAITPKRRAGDKQEEDSSETNAAQEDLALSEPGDWTGLLDDDAGTEDIQDEDEEHPAAIDNLSSSTVAEPEQEPSPVELDQPVDLDQQFEMQAEAMGLEITGRHDIGGDALTDEIPLLDEDFAEPTNIESTAEAAVNDDPDIENSDEFELISEDLADNELEDGPDDVDSMADDQIEDEPEDGSDEADSVADDLVEDDAWATNADEPENDDSIAIEMTDQEEIGDDTDDVAAIRGTTVESTGEFEANIDVAARALDDDEIRDWSDDDSDSVADSDENDDLIEDADEADDEADEISADDSEPVADTTDDEEQEISAEDEALIREIEADEVPDSDDELAAPTDEDEQTIMEAFGADVASKMFDENSAEVETIIMEGEFVRSAIDKERLTAENDARDQIDDYGKLADTYALNRESLRGGRRKYDPTSFTVISGIVVLGILLIGQVIHDKRDSLATFGFFNQTMGPVYRMLGSPITPEWDIKGWQFESTSGSTADEENVLTVFSRLVNKSEQPLPFPLVHVSLTDRWEEIIGSRVIEPNDYLAGDLDPSKPVTPGENFTAVITIDSPSDEATGFKLNVCYRVTPGRVRCAIEDFKN